MARDDDDDDDGDPWDVVNSGWEGLKDFFGDHRTEEEKERSLETAYQNQLAEEDRWNDTSGDSDYEREREQYKKDHPNWQEEERIERERWRRENPSWKYNLKEAIGCWGCWPIVLIFLLTCYFLFQVSECVAGR